MGDAVLLDPVMGSIVVNATDIDNAAILAAATQQAPEVAAMMRWGIEMQRKGGGIFERDRYVTPHNFFDQIRTAQDAAEHDDVVAGVIETTEALAFGRLDFECEDADEEDVWDQWAQSIDLGLRLREMWRELFICSQFYAVTWWGRKSFKVRGRNTSGIKRKKAFTNIRCPIAMSILDPMKVVPVGSTLFNQEQLAYIAEPTESTLIDASLQDLVDEDLVIKNLITGRYEPDVRERQHLSDLGVNAQNLWLLNPKYVWRHTLTRPQYKTFADVRLKSIFELLDLKHQLHEMDRAQLIGATNFIVLIKKGTDQIPAKQAEIDNLKGSVSTLSRIPVIVGDHRLAIEIVTPQHDKTIDNNRYDVLDHRIASRLFQMYLPGNRSAQRDDSIKLARVITRGLEARREELIRGIRHHATDEMFDVNTQFTEPPDISFHPKNIALDFDPAVATFYMDLRDRGDVSRETMLQQLDLDQTVEAKWRKREKEYFDDIFQTTVPFTGMTPNNENPNAVTTRGGGGDPRTAGRNQGGNRNGGGSAPGSGQGQAPRKATKKATPTKRGSSG